MTTENLTLVLSEREKFLEAFFSKDKEEVTIEKITAEQAAWLYETSPGNRSHVRSNSITIGSDMRNGQFCVGNDALIFDVQNRMRNGHHRLEQQIATGTEQSYIVRRKVQEQELANIDRGAKRNLKATTEFVPGFREEYGSDLEPKEATLANTALREGGRKTSIYLSAAGSCKLALLFKDGIKWYLGVVGNRKLVKITTNSSVGAAFVRAYTSGVDKQKLEYALNYLIDGGTAIEKDNTARLNGTDSLSKLRDYLLTKQKTSAGGVAGKEIYNRTEKMLKHFLDGVEAQRVTEANEELFTVDTSAILDQDTPMQIQHRILGQKLTVELQHWADSCGIAHGSTVRPVEIANYIICGGEVNISSTTIASKLTKVVNALAKIVIGDNTLTPIYSDKGNKINSYQLIRHQQAATA